MRNLTFHLLVVVMVAVGSLAHAQQSNKTPRIGFLSASRLQPRDDAFRQGLRDLGYAEAQNVVIEWRYAEGNPDQISRNAAELARLKVDVIVTGGATDTRAARKATSTIPIVMVQDPDPVANGFVASLARPGGNITGLSAQSAEISGKQLELLKEIVPNLSRVTVLGQSTSGANAQLRKETELAAGALGLQLLYLDVLGPNDIDRVFRDAGKARADAVLALPGPMLISHRKQIADLALKIRLPAIYPRREFVEDGGLVFYGPNHLDLARRAAIYVDKILKGANPAELPVEQPTKFELVINLKAAKQIGLTIPPNVLFRADRVIK
jgi:putative tryptophan/tyrosine transport system substrate-binding protein